MMAFLFAYKFAVEPIVFILFCFCDFAPETVADEASVSLLLLKC